MTIASSATKFATRNAIVVLSSPASREKKTQMSQLFGYKKTYALHAGTSVLNCAGPSVGAASVTAVMGNRNQR